MCGVLYDHYATDDIEGLSQDSSNSIANVTAVLR